MPKDRELYESVQRRLVGSLLYDSSMLSRVLELITEDDIEEPSYSLIFSAMAELLRLDEQISQLSVAENLEAQGKLKAAGGISTLFELSADGARYLCEASPIVYARIVKESSAKSKISETLDSFKDSFKDDSGVKAIDAVSDLQTILNERLLSLSDNSTVSKFHEDFSNYEELLEDRKKISLENQVNADGLQGIPSLLPTLNKLTRGWQPGQMITVGARTGIGKSVMAVNCAVAAAKSNATVMFFSLEMSKVQIQDRIISSTTGISLNDLKQGILTPDEETSLKQSVADMQDMKIIIDTEPKMTVDMIRARALKQAQTEEGLDFIIVDYLQLVTPAGRFGNRQEAVADISRNIKLLAKQLNIPIMVLVQLNRNSGKDKDEENALPELDHIRESAAIGQDSDIVILLHRDKTMDDTTPHTLVILAKNRDGEAQKTIRCHSNLECSLFREVTRVKDLEKTSDTSDDVPEFSDMDDMMDDEGWADF